MAKVRITKPIVLSAWGCENQSCVWYTDPKEGRRSTRAVDGPGPKPVGNFVLKPADNHTYTVILKTGNSGPSEGYAEYTFNTDSLPVGGRCSVSPAQGTVIETEFRVDCSGWMDEDTPLWYEFYSEVDSSSGREILTYGTLAVTSALYLPPGNERQNNSLNLIVKVFDASGAYREVPLQVQVSVCLHIDSQVPTRRKNTLAYCKEHKQQLGLVGIIAGSV